MKSKGVVSPIIREDDNSALREESTVEGDDLEKHEKTLFMKIGDWQLPWS